MISTAALPPIPEKRYFTIGEISELCQLKPHVLRYWEQEFKQLRPSKRRGNRRYYQHKDVVLIRRIQTLLYDEGYTISGARLKLSASEAQQGVKAQFDYVLRQTIEELEAIQSLLQADLHTLHEVKLSPQAEEARQTLKDPVSCDTEEFCEFV